MREAVISSDQLGILGRGCWPSTGGTRNKLARSKRVLPDERTKHQHQSTISSATMQWKSGGNSEVSFRLSADGSVQFAESKAKIRSIDGPQPCVCVHNLMFAPMYLVAASG